MSGKTVYGMSESESIIMDYLWKAKEAKEFSEIVSFLEDEEGKQWAKQTVNTFLRRLADKGLVKAKTNGRKKMYYAALTEAEYEKEKTRRLLEDFYDGSVLTFLSALTGGKSIDSKVADKLRAIVEEDDI
ncbi:MAG: BlaI/MecI/CopY family transcriptional regulator [Clostridiales bacterium]|nr:BlaI/MecI/CopY family transcriptional regulator [Clostridiales bacterium]